MPTRKPTGTKPRTNQVFSRLQENMHHLQRDAQNLLNRTRQQATHMITRDQRRALDRLLHQAQRLRQDLEKRAQRATRDVERRADRLLATLETEAAKRISPILRRLSVPSRDDIRSLSQRIAALERRMKTPRQTAAKAKRAPVATRAGK